VVNAHHHVTMTFNTDVGKVRTLTAPEQFDDKGNRRKPTAAELRQLKGDEPAEKKLVGYKSDFSDVQVGAVVEVVLSANKANLHKGARPGKADPDAEKGNNTPGQWIAVNQLTGVVTKVNNGNTSAGPTFTMRVTKQVLKPGWKSSTHRHTVKPDNGQATLVVIHKPGTGTDKEVAGKKGKKANQ
jgi:hypothetical protein